MPMHWLDVPYLQQTEAGGCLPACVAMVPAYLEQPALQEDVSRQIGALPWGTPASNIRRLAGWGFQVRYETRSLRELQTFLAAGLPPNAFLRTVDLPYAQVDAPMRSSCGESMTLPGIFSIRTIQTKRQWLSALATLLWPGHTLTRHVL